MFSFGEPQLRIVLFTSNVLHNQELSNKIKDVRFFQEYNNKSSFSEAALLE